jgi:peptidoglycan/xylan/chitin deacetylase (PgdA/CDA1 family)
MRAPEHILARRAAQRERARRRRARLQASLGLVIVVAIGLAVVLAATSGARHPVRSAARFGSASGVGRIPSNVGGRRVNAPRLHGRLAATMALGNEQIQRLIKLGKPIYCGGFKGHDVAFTFDDGPGVYTHYAVKKLTQAHERATFFVVGKSMNAWPGWLPRELRLGAIGDHTYTHADLLEIPPSQVYTQLLQTKRLIERESGERVDLFRPPYGALDTSVDQIARRLDLLPIMWTQDSRDSLGANWAGIIHNVEIALHPGAIILMHENRGQTIRALTTLLPVLHRRHLRSVSLPELFAQDPPSIRQVEAGGEGCGRGFGRVDAGGS